MKDKAMSGFRALFVSTAIILAAAGSLVIAIISVVFIDSMASAEESAAQQAIAILPALVCDNPMIVTSTVDDIGSCGTLRYAVEYARNNPNAGSSTITFSLPAQSRIVLSGSGLNLPSGVQLQGSCGLNGPEILIDGAGLNAIGLTFSGGNRLSCLMIGGFSNREISVAGNTAKNTFDKVHVKADDNEVLPGQGGGQSTVVGTTYSQVFKVKVQKWYGAPLVGVSVTFQVQGSGAGGTFNNGLSYVTVNTDNAGVATAPAFTANGLPGEFSVVATASGYANQAVFYLRNQVGQPNTLIATEGTSQTAIVGSAFGVSMKALVRDSYGNGVSGVGVTFTAPDFGPRGSFGGASSVTVYTNLNGEATAPTFTANGVPGSYSVYASVSGLISTANYNFTNLPGGPASITVIEGSSQSVNIGTAFPVRFKAVVKDAYGNNLSGVSVAFSAPGSGASGTFSGGIITAYEVTNSNGEVTAPVFTANMAAGSYTVYASVSGVGTSAIFSLSNFYGPTTITAWVTNASPGKYTNVTVYGELIINGLPVNGATMDTTWHYRTTTSYCSDISGANGVASCTKNTGNVTIGYTVVIDVVFTFNGQTYTAFTGFTPV